MKVAGKHDQASEHWKVWNALDLHDEEDKHKEYDTIPSLYRTGRFI